MNQYITRKGKIDKSGMNLDLNLNSLFRYTVFVTWAMSEVLTEESGND